MQQKENKQPEEKREDDTLFDNQSGEDVPVDVEDNVVDMSQPKEEYVFKVPPEGRSTLCKLNDVALSRLYEVIGLPCLPSSREAEIRAAGTTDTHTTAQQTH